MINEIHGPVNALKRAVKSGNDRTIKEAAAYFVDQIETDIYDNKGKFTESDDAVIKLLFGHMDSSIMADELHCSMYQLYARATQLNKFSPGYAPDEVQIQAVKTMHGKGASLQQIADVLGVEYSDYQYMTSPRDKNNIIDAENKFDSQQDFFNSEGN